MKKILWFTVLIIGAGILAYVHLVEESSSSNRQSPFQRNGEQQVSSLSSENRRPAEEEQEALFAAEREELSAGYREEYAKAKAEALARILAIFREYQGAVPGVSETSAEAFMGFLNLSRCVGYGASDRVFQTTYFIDYTEEAMKPAVDLIAEMNVRLQAVVEGYFHALEAIRNRYESEILRLSEKFDLPLSTLPVPDFAELSRLADELRSRASSAGLSVLLDVILIKGTYKSVWKVLERLIVRQAAVASASGTAAVIDGPLPVGDFIGGCIAVGGTAWTAWEIRQAVVKQNEFPEKLEEEIRGQLRQLFNATYELLDESDSVIEALLAIS